MSATKSCRSINGAACARGLERLLFMVMVMIKTIMMSLIVFLPAGAAALAVVSCSLANNTASSCY